MKNQGTLLLGAAIAALAAVPVAQKQLVYIPQGRSMDKKFGRWSMPAPFESAPSRVQQIIRAGEVAKTSALISAFALRSKWVHAPLAGITLNSLAVDMGYGAMIPEKMSGNYNANRGKGIRRILSGKFVLPNIMPNPNPAAFQINFPMGAPFSYSVAKGPLLIDMINTGKYSYGGWSYEMDSIPSSTARKIQLGGCGRVPGSPSCPVYVVNNDGRATTIGTTTTLDVFDLPKAWPTFAVFGVSRLSWNGVRLPLDLSQFGAPAGSKLWVSPDVTLPMTTYLRKTAPYPNRHAARLSVKIPNIPQLGGAKFYTQAYTAHGVGALPISTTTAWILVVGDTLPAAQLLFSPWASGNGFYFGGSRGGGGPGMFGGMVVRLQGTFQ